jgi:hypothetical protein
VETIREDFQTVKYLPACQCFVCGIEIRRHQTYCVTCIAADRRRCFLCGEEYSCSRDHIGCQTCEPRPPRPLTLAESICAEFEDDSPPSIRAWLRTTAQWQTEGLGGTLRQVELRLLAAAHSLLSVRRRLDGLRGKTRRVAIDCLGRVVHSEAMAAWAGESEISRLAAMDAAS